MAARLMSNFSGLFWQTPCRDLFSPMVMSGKPILWWNGIKTVPAWSLELLTERIVDSIQRTMNASKRHALWAWWMKMTGISTCQQAFHHQTSLYVGLLIDFGTFISKPRNARDAIWMVVKIGFCDWMGGEHHLKDSFERSIYWKLNTWPTEVYK